MTESTRPGLPRGKLIGLTQAAERLGVSTRTLRSWTNRITPAIRYWRPGDSYKFDTADIEDYLIAHSVEGNRRIKKEA